MQPLVLFLHQTMPTARPDHHFFGQCSTLDELQAALEPLREKYEFVRLEEVRNFRDRNDASRKTPVLLTFDDGFRHNLLAAERLHALGMSGVFYIVSETIERPFMPWFLRFAHILSTRRRQSGDAPWGRIDFSKRLNRRQWMYRGKEHLLSLSTDDRTAVLDRLSDELQAAPLDASDPDYQFLTAADLRRMVELGMTIGCHSATHDNLARLDESALRREMCDSADHIEQAAGCKIDSISYPDGRYSDAVLRVAKTRFRTGFTIRPDRWGGDELRLGRRAADGVVDLAPVLSPWYPLQCRARGAVRTVVDQWI